ncbi:MAG TPA: putative PEP-binding protein, partial [Chloroflexota bacterium]|nr:putative PEP-binding protein [Chloroflexota bacterium]
IAAVGAAGFRTPDHLEAGIMVEVPATALRIGDFAAEADFFSIGTNDLGQYLFAADRGNASVAALGDGHQPALLELIGDVVRAAHLAGKPVTVCGELASDLSLVPILIGLGVDELSVSPVSIPNVERAIRTTNFAEAVGLARSALSFTSADALRAWLG